MTTQQHPSQQPNNEHRPQYQQYRKKRPLWYLFTFVILLCMTIIAHPSFTNAQWLVSENPSIPKTTHHKTSSIHTPMGHTGFEFVGPPTISMATYQAVFCSPRYGTVSDACSDAPQMYQMLVDAGIDPVIELAFAAKETEFGITGPGRVPQYNLHNIICNGLDRSTCQGPYHTRFATYASYPHAIQAWIDLMLYRGTYVDAGRTNFRSVLPIYAPSFENNVGLYIAQAESWVMGWRSWENSPTFSSVSDDSTTTPPEDLGDPHFSSGEVIANMRDIDMTGAPSNLDKPTIPIEAVAVVDNNGAGFHVNQDTWLPGWCGVHDKHVSTKATSSVQQSRSRALWETSSLQPGIYEVLIYIPACGHGVASNSVQYIITHDAGTSYVTINQESHTGQWVNLGAYSFGKHASPMVEMTDLSLDHDRYVLADAVAWIPSKLSPETIPSEEDGESSMPQIPMGLQNPHTSDNKKWFTNPTPTPDTIQDVHTISLRGNLHSIPAGDNTTIVAHLCPSDMVVVLAEQQQENPTWLHVRVLSVSARCEGTYATVGMEGWIQDMIVAEMEP